VKPEIKQRRAGKRAAVAAEDARARAKAAAKERAMRLRGQVLVNVENLRPTNSYGTPDFVKREFYVDRPFHCKDCGKPEIWTASQQKWWYESAKGDVWTVAIRCRPCRRRERERILAARQAGGRG
jgi:Probable zinc-ribbon domain